MDNPKTTIQERTEMFAIRIIKAYSEINKRHFDEPEKILAKQLLRSGTSIGANCAEAVYAQSKKDFINKYSIALKEASETQYWIKIMIKSQLISAQKFHLIDKEIVEIIKILTSIIKKIKAN